MDNTKSLKNKIILLIILSIAAGFLSLLPPNNTTKQKNLSTNLNQNKDTIKCYNPKKTDLTVISQKQMENVAENSCLFVGCSSFNF